MERKLILQKMAQNLDKKHSKELADDYLTLKVLDSKEITEEMQKKYFKNGEFHISPSGCKKTLSEMFKKQGEIYAQKYAK